MTSTGEDAPDTRTGVASAFDVELNGLNTIQEHERKGRPRDLFWPWFGANVSVFGLSYGSFLLGFGISFWQATIVGVVGIVASFLLMIACLTCLAGIIVDGTRKARHEMSRLAYMRHPAVRDAYVKDPGHYAEAVPIAVVPAPRVG